MRRIDYSTVCLFRLASVLLMVVHRSNAFVKPSSRITPVKGQSSTDGRMTVALHNTRQDFWGFLNKLNPSKNGSNDPGPPVNVSWNPWQAAEFIIWHPNDDSQEAGRQLAPMIVHWSGKEVAEFLTRIYLGEKHVSLRKIVYESKNVRRPQWFGLDNDHGLRQLTALLMKALPDGVLTPREIVSCARMFLLKYHSWPADFKIYGVNQHLEGDTFATRGHSADIAQVLGSVRKQRIGEFSAQDVVTMVSLAPEERYDEDKKNEILALADFFANLGIKLTATDKVNVVHGMAIGGWTPSNIAKLVGQIKLQQTNSDAPAKTSTPPMESPYYFAAQYVATTPQADAPTQQQQQTTVQEVEQILETEITTRGTISIHQPRSTISLTAFLYGAKHEESKNQKDVGPPPFNTLTNNVRSQNGYSYSVQANEYSYFASVVSGSSTTSPTNYESPPLGIPILYDWVQYMDGSISGRIKNSPGFTDGTFVSTTPVPTGAKGGDVVSTSSGSKYYLQKLQVTSAPSRVETPQSPVKQPIEEVKVETTTIPETIPFSQARATMSLTEFLTKHKDEISGNHLNNAGPPPFPLPSFLNGQMAQSRKSETSTYSNGVGTATALQTKPVILPSIAAPTAPAGVPTLYNWVQYVDGSIFGRIKGSHYFEDGTYITTSPIQTGVEGGQTVRTASGSRYFLESPRDQASRLSY